MQPMGENQGVQGYGLLIIDHNVFDVTHNIMVTFTESIAKRYWHKCAWCPYAITMIRINVVSEHNEPSSFISTTKKTNVV